MDKSIIVSITDLMLITSRSYRTCIKYKQEILAKCGKGKKDKMTIGDVSKVFNTSTKVLFKLIYPNG